MEIPFNKPLEHRTRPKTHVPWWTMFQLGMNEVNKGRLLENNRSDGQNLVSDSFHLPLTCLWESGINEPHHFPKLLSLYLIQNLRQRSATISSVEAQLGSITPAWKSCCKKCHSYVHTTKLSGQAVTIYHCQSGRRIDSEVKQKNSWQFLNVALQKLFTCDVRRDEVTYQKLKQPSDFKCILWDAWVREMSSASHEEREDDCCCLDAALSRFPKNNITWHTSVFRRGNTRIAGSSSFRSYSAIESARNILSVCACARVHLGITGYVWFLWQGTIHVLCAVV